MIGFGIPVLVERVHELIRGGVSMEDAISRTADECELRSEAIRALRAALPPADKQP